MQVLRAYVKLLKEMFHTCLGKPKSCKEIKHSDPSAATGIYEIEIGGQIIELVCDMESSGGGWAVSLFMY